MATKIGLSTTALGGFAAAAAGIAGVIALFDALDTSADEAQKTMSNSVSAYENTKSEIETLNNELEITRERIDELNAKENLSLVEQEELSNLQLTNAELERTLALKEAQLKIDAKKAALDASETYREYTTLEAVIGGATASNAYNKEAIEKAKSDYLASAIGLDNSYNRTVNRIDVIKNNATANLFGQQKFDGFQLEDIDYDNIKDNINEIIGAYEAIQQEQKTVSAELDVIAQKGETATENDLKQAKALEEYNDSLSKSALEAQKYMTNYASTISEVYSAYKNAEDLGVITPEQKAQLSTMEEVMTEINRVAVGAKSVESSIDNIFAKASLIGVKDDLVEAGKISEEVLNGVIESTPALSAELNKAGISAQELSNYIMAIADPDALRLDVIKEQLADSFIPDVKEIGAHAKQAKETVWNEFISDKSDEEIEIFYKYVNKNDLDMSDWNKEDLEYNLSLAVDGEKEVTETIGSLAEILGNESYSSAIKKYKEDVASLYEALNSLDKGEIDNTALTELYDQFPKLAEESDDLKGGIEDLIDTLNTDTETMFDEILEQMRLSGAEQSAIDAAERYKTALINSLNEIEIPNIYADLQKEEIAKALETANAGTGYENARSYLEQAKELYDKGLVGTDEFKEIARYLSPTGATDATNFAENYAKAARYLTEDSSGVQNFLEDLRSKGFAELNAETQEWSYNIEDVAQAAQDMGIGFEFFMDMFGRLEDYGAHNNFFGSVEEGEQHITDVTDKLVTAQMELAQLEAQGANETALQAKRDEVAQYTQDLADSQELLNDFTASAGEREAKQADQALKTLEGLAQVRKDALETSGFSEDSDYIQKLDEQIQQFAKNNNIELDGELNIVGIKKDSKDLQEGGLISNDIPVGAEITELSTDELEKNKELLEQEKVELGIKPHVSKSDVDAVTEEIENYDVQLRIREVVEPSDGSSGYSIEDLKAMTEKELTQVIGVEYDYETVKSQLDLMGLSDGGLYGTDAGNAILETATDYGDTAGESIKSKLQQPIDDLATKVSTIFETASTIAEKIGEAYLNDKIEQNKEASSLKDTPLEGTLKILGIELPESFEGIAGNYNITTVDSPEEIPSVQGEYLAEEVATLNDPVITGIYEASEVSSLNGIPTMEGMYAVLGITPPEQGTDITVGGNIEPGKKKR